MPVSAAVMRRLRRRTPHGGSGLPVFTPPDGLWIGGVNLTPYLVYYSPTLKFTISPYAGTFKCQLDGPAAVMNAVQDEQEMTWSRAGVQFAGRVRIATPDDQVVAGNLTLDVDCQDYTSYLDDDICNFGRSEPRTFPYRDTVETDAQRIQWLINSFGRHSITTCHVQTNYATVPAADYTGKTLREAIKSVLDFSDGSFYVDYAKDLHAFVDERIYAPFTLAESPDNLTSFAYGELEYPADSVDLRNAVYVVPGTPDAALLTVDSVTIDAKASSTRAALSLASFKVTRRPFLVAAGPLKKVLASPTTAAFGQPTTAGDFLVAYVEDSVADTATTSPGWVLAIATTDIAPSAYIFYKPNCANNETPPTFTSTGSPFVQLAEFRGVAIATPLDNTASATGLSGLGVITATAAALDQAFAELLITCLHVTSGSAFSRTYEESYGNDTGFFARLASTQGDDSASTRQFYFGYAVTGIAPTWYEDAASLALYPRREASISASDAKKQADVTALGAAFLAENAMPRREGSFKCWQSGIGLGQRLTIQSSLLTIATVSDPLGNYSGIVQGVDVEYPESQPGPEFTVQFLKPTLTLGVQLAGLKSTR